MDLDSFPFRQGLSEQSQLGQVELTVIAIEQNGTWFPTPRALERFLQSRFGTWLDAAHVNGRHHQTASLLLRYGFYRESRPHRIVKECF